jgi:hypothetical protein
MLNWLNLVTFYWINLGKESVKSIKSVGEASGTGKRSPWEEANSRVASSNASIA